MLTDPVTPGDVLKYAPVTHSFHLVVKDVVDRDKRVCLLRSSDTIEVAHVRHVLFWDADQILTTYLGTNKLFTTRAAVWCCGRSLLGEVDVDSHDWVKVSPGQ